MARLCTATVSISFAMSLHEFPFISGQTFVVCFVAIGTAALKRTPKRRGCEPILARKKTVTAEKLKPFCFTNPPAFG